jgi:hypothetical protein
VAYADTSAGRSCRSAETVAALGAGDTVGFAIYLTSTPEHAA